MPFLNFFMLKTVIYSFYLDILFRHLGFIVKNRQKTWNPIRILKLIIGSIYLFLQDKCLKLVFDGYLRLTSKQVKK